MEFELLHTPQILFGTQQFQSIGAVIKGYGTKALIVANEGALKEGGARRILDQMLPENDIDASFFIVKGEPDIEMIDRGVTQGKEFTADTVVGIGGGGAIDAGKVIAGLITNGGSARDYMEVIGKGFTITKPALQYIAIPTTAGTGSEVTKNGVISAKKEGFKASIRSPLLVPSIAIIDPSLMITVPPDVTARCGMDALTQVIEPYTSNKAQPITDNLAKLGMKTAAGSILTTYLSGDDIQAREAMALTSLLGGISLANVGLGAVHGFAAPMGGMFPIPHGTICATLLAPTVEINIRELEKKDLDHPVLKKYAHIGKFLTGKSFSSPKEAHEALVEFLYKLTKDLNIPSLNDTGISSNEFFTIVEKAKKSSSMRYNPIMLNDQALYEILDRAF
ncbi:MAG: iron-containing alcohol dehydrogenase [Candidatus Hodarchaeota archaeon]